MFCEDTDMGYVWFFLVKVATSLLALLAEGYLKILNHKKPGTNQIKMYSGGSKQKMFGFQMIDANMSVFYFWRVIFWLAVFVF